MNTIHKQLPFIKGFSIAVTFSLILLFIRIIKLESNFFLFLVWNLFLACIPYGVTTILSFNKIHKNRFLFGLGFICWLVFLPNAPYILTDLQHIRVSTLHSVWFDVLLILSFAINGLIVGFASLRTMQELLQTHFSKKATNFITHLTLLLCGFGIYMGRVLRWNSWDLLQNPMNILGDIFQRIIFPIEHINSWAFTLGFGGFLIITYHLFYHYNKENN
ncbi:DUF1361 domain-containing protein [Aquimarina sp. BL5]|uniref:DUF1361 domain-containing protein n=1 Tax=Aquimarina sp. BL5 TaxID=1714860 RepID=UPI000E54FF14|nr:DUF1361 domain-containing protein [Aquimarina sp. BL5]AXT50919.1 DUF1361 domain-containing protein [Aquimarina sp. BL5]RKM90744.1 DUF1361 domain-containing protein [Aquimarina sp. BL5]